MISRFRSPPEEITPDTICLQTGWRNPFARQSVGPPPPAAKPPAKPVEKRAPTVAELAAPYIAEFGRERGAVLFAKGFSLEASRAEFRREQQEANKAECAERAEAGKKFLTEFGEVGARWFAEGKTYEEARAEFARTRMSRLNSGLKSLYSTRSSDTELRANPSSGAPPTPIAPADAVPYACRNACGSDAIAALAATIKLPSSK